MIAYLNHPRDIPGQKLNLPDLLWNKLFTIDDDGLLLCEETIEDIDFDMLPLLDGLCTSGVRVDI